MGCVAGVGPYRWSKAGQLFLALALRFSSGLVPLLYLLLYLCLKTPHTQTRVFNMPWRTPQQQQQQQTTKGSDSKTKTAVWESSNQGKLRLYNGSFCLCVQSPWCWVSLRGQRKVSYIDSCATTPTSLESTLRLKVALSLTPLVVFAVLRVSLHAVVQFHQDRFQTGVHPLDQLMVHHQRPQQNAQRWKAAWRMNMGFFLLLSF